MSTLTPDDVLLALLAAEPLHGYAILDIFRDPHALGSVWQLSTSQLYAVLKRLETLGLIVGRTVETDSAPPRTEYAPTEAGYRRLAAWLDEPHPSSSVRQVRVAFLSRLYAAYLLRLPTAPIIERQRAACCAERDRLRALAQTPSAGMDDLARTFVLAQLDAVIGWIDRYAAQPLLISLP